MALHTHLGLVQFILLLTWCSRAADHPPPTELLPGFSATPDPSVQSFQPLLADSTGNYSLGFLRLDHLSLSVVHVPSSVPLWSARTIRPVRWADKTQLLFNGSLVLRLSDPRAVVLWSTHTDGGRVWLSNTSNLVIQTHDGEGVAWQSFDSPSDTIVEDQNFTGAMALVSSNGKYSMRLGSDYFGLYAKFSISDRIPDQMYLKHGALEAKAAIVAGLPIYLVLKPGGYLGMYQNGSTPVDVLPFNTFQQDLTGFRRVRIEPDGNLKAYYWTSSTWILDYQAIRDSCELLPSSCGSYGLCRPGKDCSCLDNQTAAHECAPPQDIADFCGDARFRVMRRTGVELAFKELMPYRKTASYAECEDECHANCTCWGVMYSNSSGFCYTLQYPAKTVVAVAEKGKLGYFKVREGVGKRKVGTWVGVVLGVILVFGGVAGLEWYKWRRRRVKGYSEEGSIIGPYKDLGAASFRSIELCEKR